MPYASRYHPIGASGVAKCGSPHLLKIQLAVRDHEQALATSVCSVSNGSRKTARVHLLDIQAPASLARRQAPLLLMGRKALWLPVDTPGLASLVDMPAL